MTDTITSEEDWNDDNEPDYELSANQRQFVEDSQKHGHRINYNYLAPRMGTVRCPAIRVVGWLSPFTTTSLRASATLGDRVAVYAPF